MNHVGRSYEIDVMAALLLKRDHHVREVMAGDLLPPVKLGYDVILTENSFQSTL
jgi:hypothetical protein